MKLNYKMYRAEIDLVLSTMTVEFNYKIEFYREYENKGGGELE